MQVGKRRRGAAAAVLTALSLVAAACSLGPSSKPPVVLQVLMTDDWVTPPFLSAVRDFEKLHPEVRVEVEREAIALMLDAVAARTRQGEPPDVVQAHAFSAAAQGLAEPLDDLWAKSLKPSEFLPGAIDDVTWGDHLYGVPLDTNALILLYNQEHFAGAGLESPSGRVTFREFEEQAKALSRPDGSRRALAIPTSTWWTYGWIKANGGEVIAVDADGGVRLTLDAPEVVSALDFLSRLVKANLAFPPRATDSHSGDALSLFRAGSSSTLASGTWDLSILGKDAKGERFRSSLLPVGSAEGGTVMGGSSMFVPTGSKNRVMAFEFMKHLVSDRYALRLAKEQGRLPVRPRVYEDPFFDRPELATVLEQLPTASPFKLSAFPEAHDIFATAVDEILRGGGDAAAVMAAAQARAQAVVPASP